MASNRGLVEVMENKIHQGRGQDDAKTLTLPNQRIQNAIFQDKPRDLLLIHEKRDLLNKALVLKLMLA